MRQSPLADPGDYNSTVTIGTSSSGKTHLKDQADRLFTHLDVMDASTGSDKVLIYSDDWDEADIISMGELNQPSDEMIEFMKRAHGGDEEVVIRSTRGNPHDGFHEEVIRKDAKSYHFTFAQFESDFEFWNRLLKIPVHESESKNRAVGRMAFDHGDIGLDDTAEYGYEFREGTERLQAHMLEMKRRAPKRVVVPNGAEGFEIDTWAILEPIFNHERSESNRVYTMVANLIKASALLNYQSRETIEISTETTDGETVTTDALLAEPQDVANVCRCLETLRATTHEIDARKRAVIEAIRTKGGEDNTVEDLEPIVEYLEESDASQVNKPELEAIIDDLEADYLVTTDGSAITARNWDALGEPKIGEYAEAFAECVDPINGEPFLESWRNHRADVRADGSDLLGEINIDSDPDDPTEPERLEDPEYEPADGELEPHQRAIYTVVADSIDGAVVDDPKECSIEAFIGLVQPGESITSVRTEGTLLDPDHNVWDVDDKADAWVTTETDARRELQTAIRAFVDLELLGLEYTGEGVRINAETV